MIKFQSIVRFFQRIILLSVFTILLPPSKAQNLVKLRSSNSLNASSKSLTLKNNSYRIIQSIGQSGITGTLKNSNSTIIQGFIQPKIIRSQNLPKNELNVLIEAIPFSDSYKIIFTDNVSTNYNVDIYNIMGQKVYTKKYESGEEIEINLESHAIGCYILSIQSNQQQFSTKLIKK